MAAGSTYLTGDSGRTMAGSSGADSEKERDLDVANIDAGSAGAGTKKKGTLPLPVLQGTQGRKGQRTMLLLNSPFLEEEGFGGAGAVGATSTPHHAGVTSIVNSLFCGVVRDM